MEIFTREIEDYVQKTGDKNPSKYECFECVCIFYGAWHSRYSMHKVKCPVCMDETDPYMIRLL